MQTLVTQLGNLPIRRATPDDAGAVFDIMCDAAAWLASRGIDQWRQVPTDAARQAIGRRVATWPVYLLDYKEQPVATICLQDTDIHTWTDPADHATPAGYVHGLAICACVRGKGIGRSLLLFAESEFRSQGKRFIRLDCIPDNHALSQYYLADGYQEVRVNRNRLMQKPL